ncbi:hypothetical protein SOASR031_20940 [Leminorella grimontii]|nr:hypothetical protein SOASR031_20940 [Leminorella grimontii]
MILCTHRLSGLRYVNEILVLQEGRIAQQSTHAALMALAGWYRNMYRYQQLETALDE